MNGLPIGEELLLASTALQGTTESYQFKGRVSPIGHLVRTVPAVEILLNHLPSRNTPWATMAVAERRALLAEGRCTYGTMSALASPLHVFPLTP